MGAPPERSTHRELHSRIIRSSSPIAAWRLAATGPHTVRKQGSTYTKTITSARSYSLPYITETQLRGGADPPAPHFRAMRICPVLRLTLKRIASVSICSLALSTVVLGASHAQKPIAPSAPPAHVPPEILTAKTIFISNLGGDCDPNAPRGASVLAIIPPAAVYERFYEDVEKWRRYTIVSAPDNTNLIFEIRMRCRAPDPLLSLVIRDTRSRAVLWTINVYVQGSSSKRTVEKQWNKSMQTVLSDLKELAGQNPPSGPSGKPSRSK